MITGPGAPFHVFLYSTVSTGKVTQGRLHREGHCFCCGPSFASGHLCYLAPGGQSELEGLSVAEIRETVTSSQLLIHIGQRGAVLCTFISSVPCEPIKSITES